MKAKLVKQSLNEFIEPEREMGDPSKDLQMIKGTLEQAGYTTYPDEYPDDRDINFGFSYNEPGEDGEHNEDDFFVLGYVYPEGVGYTTGNKQGWYIFNGYHEEFPLEGGKSSEEALEIALKLPETYETGRGYR